MARTSSTREKASASPEGSEFREGDRVVYVGDPPAIEGPEPGERGWVIGLDPGKTIGVIVMWDTYGTQVEDEVSVRAVGDRNESDPAKRLPGDPYGGAG